MHSLLGWGENISGILFLSKHTCYNFNALFAGFGKKSFQEYIFVSKYVIELMLCLLGLGRNHFRNTYFCPSTLQHCCSFYWFGQKTFQEYTFLFKHVIALMHSLMGRVENISRIHIFHINSILVYEFKIVYIFYRTIIT